MTKKIVTVSNRAGIHARPAAMLVETAQKFKSTILIEKEGTATGSINGKSIIGILTLYAAYDCKLIITTDGEDENEAVGELVRLIESKFEEE